MKTRLIVVLLGFLGSGMFVACRDDASDKDDDRPGKAVELAFQAKYPGATGVEWESKGVFREADFTLNGRDMKPGSIPPGSGCRQNMRSLIPRFLLR